MDVKLLASADKRDPPLQHNVVRRPGCDWLAVTFRGAGLVASVEPSPTTHPSVSYLRGRAGLPDSPPQAPGPIVIWARSSLHVEKGRCLRSYSAPSRWAMTAYSRRGLPRARWPALEDVEFLSSLLRAGRSQRTPGPPRSGIRRRWCREDRGYSVAAVIRRALRGTRLRCRAHPLHLRPGPAWPLLGDAVHFPGFFSF